MRLLLPHNLPLGSGLKNRRQYNPPDSSVETLWESYRFVFLNTCRHVDTLSRRRVYMQTYLQALTPT